MVTSLDSGSPADPEFVQVPNIQYCEYYWL